MKRISCLFLTIVMLLSISNTVFAAEQNSNESLKTLSTSDLSRYQDVINNLNEEYGYSMSFAPEVFSRSNSYESPTKLTIAEFETQLRKDIEADIAINNETKAAVAALGENAEWETVPYLGKSYNVPVNVSYSNSQVTEEIKTDVISFQNDIENKEVSTRSSSQTITSVEPRLDPTGNVAFLLNTTIYTPTYWRFNGVSSFSYMTIYSGARYIPTAVSRSYIDSSRTIAATFTCKYYNASGVLVNSNSSVYREFYASGDCITNWPNYTISKTQTNKTYKLIDDFTNSQNCAGYAWNHNSFVGMDSLGITWSQLNNCSSLSALRSLVKSKSENYMSNHSIAATVISAYNTSINTSSQYRVVMRVGYNDANGNGEWDFSVNPGYDDWDYHWWMQLGDGSWADKRGGFPSRIIPNSNNYTNPDNILWTTYNFGSSVISDFYNSTPVYYKITG